MSFVKEIIDSVLGLVYPEYCVGCGRPLVTGEKNICLHCLTDLPYTYINDSRQNVVSQIFFGRIRNFEKSYSLCYFSKRTKLQHILHALKYQRKPDVGIELGELLGLKLQQTGLDDFDILLPVPLHYKKEHLRGYNQSEKICEGIAKVLDCKIDTVSVRRKIFTQTQTKKGKLERWENVKDAFEVVKPKKLANKHILIVDDVITTGATIDALASKIEKEVENVKISIASVALAQGL